MASTVKVFFGNLPFSMSQDDLKTTVALSGKVVDAQLIMRGSRSLGYGFVEMASEADAQAVVRALHKKTIDQREINVEIARSRVTDAELAERAAKPKSRTRGPRRADGEQGGEQGGERRVQQPRGDGQQGGERRQGGNRQGGERQGGDRQQSGQQGGDRNNNNNNGGGRPPRQPRADGQQGGSRPERAERAPRVPDAERPVSETTIFVANLPFSATNAELLEFFKPAKAIDAVVSCRPSGRSKGFGFVKVAKADLANAVASMDNKQLADRKLTVRVAMTEFDTEKERNANIQQQIANAPKDSGVPAKRQE